VFCNGGYSVAIPRMLVGMAGKMGNWVVGCVCETVVQMRRLCISRGAVRWFESIPDS
jgi:hypothetical protein